MSRFFTLAEAREHLPRVRKAMQDAVASKSQFEKADAVLRNLMHRIMIMGGIAVDRESAQQIRDTRERSNQRLGAAMEEIEEVGCLVKDLDLGLVDFPTLLRGEEVYLCWRVGESDIEFWHGINEGFGGRKPIANAFE